MCCCHPSKPHVCLPYCGPLSLCAWYGSENKINIYGGGVLKWNHKGPVFNLWSIVAQTLTTKNLGES